MVKVVRADGAEVELCGDEAQAVLDDQAALAAEMAKVSLRPEKPTIDSLRADLARITIQIDALGGG